jgi:hypothetical protein
MSVTPRSTLQRRLFAFLAAGIGGTFAAAISFAMTVYEAANPEVIPSVAVGEPVDTGRWTVTFREARTGTVPPTGVEPYEPKNFVMVEFDAGNRSAAAAHVSSRLFTFDPPMENLPEPTFYLVRDKWIAGAINPGMPERLIAAWEWPEALPLPGDLRIKVGSEIYKRRDNLYGASGWFDRDPVAIVELPVTAAESGAAQ